MPVVDLELLDQGLARSGRRIRMSPVEDDAPEGLAGPFHQPLERAGALPKPKSTAVSSSFSRLILKSVSNSHSLKSRVIQILSTIPQFLGKPFRI